jgi:Flp pilus assembly protein TadD, contains TPR repeats
MPRLKESFAWKAASGVVLLAAFFFAAQNVSAANVISGVVYDNHKNPLNGVDVELLDEYYRLLQRVRTDSVGRYQFSGLNNGNYTVRVLPFQYDLEDQSQYLEVQAISARPGDPGTLYVTQDFYLRAKKGGLRDVETGVIFAQEIPKEAKKIYEKAVDDFAKKRDGDGFNGLKKALSVFPTYFDALYRFGKELYLRKRYDEAFQVFIRAVEVNPKSAESFYYLGASLYNLGVDYNKAALTSLNRALILAPASPRVLWMLGRAERTAGKYAEAEKHLLQAKKLSGTKVPEIQKELTELYANDLKNFNRAADELEIYLKVSKLTDSEEKQIKGVIAKLRAKAKSQSDN